MRWNFLTGLLLSCVAAPYEIRRVRRVPRLRWAASCCQAGRQLDRSDFGSKSPTTMVQFLLSKPARPSATIPGSTLTAILVVGGMVAALYFGREVLVPIALAVLLSFVLAPLVRRLQSWRFPRIIAVAIVAIFAFAIIFGLGAFMVSQVSQLANDLPRYELNLTDKIQSLQGVAAGTGPLERASDVLKDLKREIEKPGNVSPAEPSLGGQAQPSRPIPVEVKQPDPGALQLLAALIEPRFTSDHDGYRGDICDLHFASAERSEKSACAPRRRERPSPHDGGS